MSDYTDKKIADLEGELRVAQELLFLVLDHINEPVVLDVAEAKKGITKDKIIDLNLDEEAGTWTLRVVALDG